MHEITDLSDFYSQVGWNEPPYSHARREQLVQNLRGFYVYTLEDGLIKTYHNASADRYSWHRRMWNNRGLGRRCCECLKQLCSGATRSERSTS